MPRALVGLSAPHRVESGEPFTVDRYLDMNIVVRQGGLREEVCPIFCNRGMLLDVAHLDQPSMMDPQSNLRGAEASALRLSTTCVLREA